MTLQEQGRGLVPGKARESPDSLRARIFEVDQDGTSTPKRDNAGNRLEKTIPSSAVLEVSTEGGQDTSQRKHLKLPPSEGMAAQPVAVSYDDTTGYWAIRNNGNTNTLRVQQYGLGAVPLHPGATTAMSGQDVAVWIPVNPPWSRSTGKGEAFRLLLLKMARFPLSYGNTKMITGPEYDVSEATKEALIVYFGQYLSWPPLVAPHVRGATEVSKMAAEVGLVRDTDLDKWARNRHEVLTGNDGLFTDADWYPQIGGKQRTLPNHLSAFHRLVERRTITLALAERWAKKHGVSDFISIDRELKAASQ